MNLQSSVMSKYVPILRSILSKTQLEYQAFYLHKNSIQAFNGERRLILSSPKINLNSEQIAVNGDVFADIMRISTQGEWAVRIEQQVCYLANNNQNITLQLMQLNEVNMQIDLTDELLQGELEAEKFKQAVKGVMFAASTGNSKPILQGVSLKIKNNQITFAATDGYKIAQSSYHAQAQDLETILSQKTLSTLLNLLDISPTTISLFKQGNNLIFKGKGELDVDWIFETNVIAGSFPVYEQFFTPSSKVFSCDAKLLQMAVSQAGVIVRDGQIVCLIFSADQVLVKSSHVNLGSYQNCVPGHFENIEENQAHTLNFNLPMLDKILRMFKDKINIHIKQTGPILFAAQNNTDSIETSYVLLPFTAH